MFTYCYQIEWYSTANVTIPNGKLSQAAWDVFIVFWYIYFYASLNFVAISLRF